MTDTESSASPQIDRKQSWLTVPVAIVLAGVLISVSIIFTSGSGSLSAAVGDSGEGVLPERVVGPTELVTEGDPVLGDPNAPVTIVEFSDFQCPYCRLFWSQTYEQLKTEYIDTGLVRLVYRDYPLSFHPAAYQSAVAGQCAQEQGRFWEFHDVVYAEQEKQGQGTISYGETELNAWAQQAGLDGELFAACLASGAHDARIDEAIAAGNRSGVTGTPTFFINGRIVIGAQPFEVLQQVIEAELEE